MLFGPYVTSPSKITSSAFLLIGLRFKDEVEIEIMFHVIHFKKAVTYMITFRGISFKIDKINISELNEIIFQLFEKLCAPSHSLIIVLNA